MAEQYFLISVAIEQPIERPPYRGWDFGYYAIKEPVTSLSQKRRDEISRSGCRTSTIRSAVFALSRPRLPRRSIKRFDIARCLTRKLSLAQKPCRYRAVRLEMKCHLSNS